MTHKTEMLKKADALSAHFSVRESAFLSISYHFVAHTSVCETIGVNIITEGEMT